MGDENVFSFLKSENFYLFNINPLSWKTTLIKDFYSISGPKGGLPELKNCLNLTGYHFVPVYKATLPHWLPGMPIRMCIKGWVSEQGWYQQTQNKVYSVLATWYTITYLRACLFSRGKLKLIYLTEMNKHQTGASLVWPTRGAGERDRRPRRGLHLKGAILYPRTYINNMLNKAVIG